MDLDVAADDRFDPVQTLPLREFVAPRRQTASNAWIKRVRSALRFLIIVVVPTLIAAVYFMFIAADQFASETRFLVRSPQRASAGMFSAFLQSTGFVRAQDDSYAVTDYIKSRTAMTRLVEKHHLLEMLARPEADIFTRFPQPWSHDTLEALFRHYLGWIKVQTDTSSGISTLEVRAFRAGDARDLALALLEEAETLVNRLNDRARQDAIRSAQQEIDSAEAHYAQVQEQLTAYRNREAMIDPDKQATSILDLISRLSSDVVEKRARIFEIERQAPLSPQLPALKASISAIEDQIARERSRVVGGNASIATRLSQYESLLLQREMAARRINSATSSLETSRLDAQRQQLYIERIVEPNLPDHAIYPRSLFLIAMTFAVAFSAYLIIQTFFGYLGHHAERR